jgi:ligand-binding sensor domain-containing protein
MGRFLPLALAIAAASSTVPVDSAQALAVSVLGTAKGIPAAPVSSLLVRGDRLYVGTRGMGLYLHDLKGGRSVRVTREDGLPSDDVTSLALFQGKVYAATSAGIAVSDGGAWSIYRRAGEVRLNNAILGVSPDGAELWAGAVHLSGGTVRFDGKEWAFIGGEGRGLFNTIDSFAFYPGGVILGAQSGAVYLRKGDAIEAIGDGFPQANVFAVAERGGTIYAGTSAGLFLFRGKTWEKATVPDAASAGAVYAFVRSGADLFVGGSKGLLLLDRKGNARFLSGERGFPQGAVTALAVGDGAVYAATEKGVAVIREWHD